MTLKNNSKHKIISSKLKEAKSFLDLLLGLHRNSNPRSLLFKTRFGIHTFGLKEPIDVIVLDQNLKVVKIKENLTPNKLFFWNPKYNLVIELPLDTIKKAKISLSDIVSII